MDGGMPGGSMMGGGGPIASGAAAGTGAPSFSSTEVSGSPTVAAGMSGTAAAASSSYSSPVAAGSTGSPAAAGGIGTAAAASSSYSSPVAAGSTGSPAAAGGTGTTAAASSNPNGGAAAGFSEEDELSQIKPTQVGERQATPEEERLTEYVDSRKDVPKPPPAPENFAVTQNAGPSKFDRFLDIADRTLKTIEKITPAEPAQTSKPKPQNNQNNQNGQEEEEIVEIEIEPPSLLTLLNPLSLLNPFSLLPRVKLKVRKKQPKNNNFADRSELELKVADAIKKKNQAIKQEKQKAREQSLDNPRVKKLTPPAEVQANSGNTNILLLTLILSFVAGAIFMVVYLLGR